jgi:sec-independent protein translocase protein TatB
MFDVALPELLLVAVVALLVIGPKDLPKAMRFVGYWVGKARGVARQFRSGFDTMVREAELADMEKKWAEENARIMRDHPPQQVLQAPEAVDVPPPVPHDFAGPNRGAVEDAPPAMVEQPTVHPAADDAEPVAPSVKTAS